MVDSMEISLALLSIDPSRAGSSGQNVAYLRPAGKTLAGLNSLNAKLFSVDYSTVSLPSRQDCEVPAAFLCNTDSLDGTKLTWDEFRPQYTTAVASTLQPAANKEVSDSSVEGSSTGVSHSSSPSSIGSSADSTDSSHNLRNSTQELDAEAELLPGSVEEAFKKMSLSGRRLLGHKQPTKRGISGPPRKFVSRTLHRVAGRIVNKCEKCTFKSRSLDDLNRHVADYHSRYTLTCLYCEYCTSNASVMYQHRRTHHTANSSVCRGCDYCFRPFITP